MADSGISNLVAESIMTARVLTIHLEMTVKEAMQMLIDNKISGGPVVEFSGSKVVISVCSEGDLMKYAASGGMDKHLKTFRLQMVSTDKLITVKKEDTFKDVFKQFLVNPVRRVIVIDHRGNLEGVISRRNILQAFMETHGH